MSKNYKNDSKFSTIKYNKENNIHDILCYRLINDSDKYNVKMTNTLTKLTICRKKLSKYS